MEEFTTPKKVIIERIKNQLSKKLREEDGYMFDSEMKWGPTSSKIILDLVVRKNGFLLAFFSISLTKESFSSTRSKYRAVRINRYERAPLQFAYCEETKKYTLFLSYSIHCIFRDQLKDGPLAHLTPINELENINAVVQLIKVLAKAYNLDKDNNASNDSDKEQPKFYKNSEKVLDPIWCREQLGAVTCKNEKSEAIQCKEICRYSSLDSLFSSIKHKTIRMNGLPGMNDKNEGLFAWNMIYKLENTANEDNKMRRRETNNAFIVSYSSSNLIDDLTQWRLYGDDAKGVCCVYSILQDKLKDRFFLHNVRYIKEPNENEEISDELLLRFLKYSQIHSDISYYDLSPAIFFYKPYSFISEDEVRLLVDNKKTSAYDLPEFKREWVLTNANNIPNPYIDIPLDDFPLKLDRIILGPNMNDVDVIQAQLETMLKQQGIDAEVILSRIDSYRNPTK